MHPFQFANFLEFSMSPLEIIVRGTIMYWLLFLLLRYVLRRDTGSAGMTGILFVVLLGDAAQNAMIGQGHTVADGAMLIVTLGAWNLLLDWLGLHVAFVARMVEAPPVVLMRNGQVLDRNLRRERVTREELEAGLRKHGIEDIDCVKSMCLEGDGTFSIIKVSR